jgi:hypothetical protein
MEVRKMRKKLLVLLFAVVSLGFVGSTVWACPWDGNYWGYRGRPMGWSWDGHGSTANPAGSYQDFLKDTATIRKELAANMGEYDALMAQPNPDPKRARQLSKEIATLQEQLRAKAQAHGLHGTTGPASRGDYYAPARTRHSRGGWRCCW